MTQNKSRLCFNAKELLMGLEHPNHEVVELVGGPLDGKRFIEEPGSPKFSHKPEEAYRFGGGIYHPWKVHEGVLYLEYQRG